MGKIVVDPVNENWPAVVDRQIRDPFNVEQQRATHPKAVSAVEPAYEPPKYKVAIARFPGDGTECSGGVTWLMRTFHEMKIDPRIEAVLSIVESNTPITMTRNKAVKDALALGVDYMLMIDNDVVPDYEELQGGRRFWLTAWAWMLARRESENLRRSLGVDELEIAASWPPAVIGAPYCGPPPDECVYVFEWESAESRNPNPDFRLRMISRNDAARRTGIAPVAALPTGLMLIDMRVFKILPPPWFRYEWGDVEESIKATTEDVYFTRNAALNVPSIPQLCTWDSWCIHRKTKDVTKPASYGVEQVQKILVDAVRRNEPSNLKLTHVTRKMVGHGIQVNSVEELDRRLNEEHF